MNKFFVISFLLPFSVMGQLSKKEIEKNLTNDSTRTWVLSDYKKTLGNNCIGTWALYTFSKRGSLETKQCINDEIYITRFTWRLELLESSNTHEYLIKFSNPIIYNGKSTDKLRINFPTPKSNKPKQKMIWRDVAQCKSCVGQIFILTALK